MLNKFSKSVTAGLLAVTLALTGIAASTSPAAANGHRNNGGEAAAVLGGLLLLYGISQVGRNNGHRGNPPVIHQPRPQPVQRVAPSRCLIQGHDGNGRFRGYRQQCMQRHAQNAHLLPQNCLRRVWTQNGQRSIYRARCLTNNGWTQG